MQRVYNFSAGPSMLPMPVLEQAASEMTDYNGSGMSVMEMSHRSPVYQGIIDAAESDLRKLMNIPDNYKVLFLQGGATTQFSAVPLNLMTGNGKADYIVSGQFSGKAAKEAAKFGEVNIIATSADKNFTYVPYVDKFSPDADYVHICWNNTIFGTTYNYIPATGDIPLVADMSSGILARPVDVSKFGVIYAGAQKNMGPSGMTLVIIREDLVGKAKENIPVMLDYKTQVENGSMYNTPPCYSIYIAGLVYKWLLETGGLEEIEKYNVRKAALLYDYLDQSKLFKPTAEKEFRSLMNVCFVTGDADKDKAFCSAASKAGFVNLKGHRSVGGMRASIYNAMPEEGVKKLVDFMAAYEKENS
ncbi:MAG: 3-phosphoserine/phosphohydroxythreonine transaminase [Clostridiales bacterium]|nr:3-phosphoserine/phosphohydroxythreonine transaminase [Candidatus Coliplasma equi]